MKAELISFAFFVHSYEIVLQIKNLRFSFVVSKETCIFVMPNNHGDLFTTFGQRLSAHYLMGFFYAHTEDM